MQAAKLFALAVGALFALGGAARADSTVEVKNVHLCCGACVSGVAKALKTVDGVTGKCDQKAKTVTITAKDDETVQKAIDAIVTAGFHGDVSGTKFKVTDDSGASAGKVKTLTLTGVHNCCGQCNTAIKKAVASVPGAAADGAKAKTDSFEVTGDFDGAAVVKALNTAGFHVKVKK